MISKVVPYLQDGLTKIRENHIHEEAQKLFIFRGGSSGICSEDGKVFVGTCPRLALLRNFGFNSDNTPAEELMFSGGYANEETWLSILNKVIPEKVLSQEKCGVSLKLPNGSYVTGRPDIVIKGEVGIELKKLCSVWTVRDILIKKGAPKVEHVIQSTLYSRCLNLPYELWYTNDVNFPVVEWMKKLFPKFGEPLSTYCDYNEKNIIKGIRPFRLGFVLTTAEDYDTTRFQMVSDLGEVMGDVTDTIVSYSSILRYYEAIGTFISNKELPPKVSNIDIFGEDLAFSKCDYCKLKEHCSKVKNWDEFFKKLPNFYYKIGGSSMGV